MINLLVDARIVMRGIFCVLHTGVLVEVQWISLERTSREVFYFTVESKADHYQALLVVNFACQYKHLVGEVLDHTA